MDPIAFSLDLPWLGPVDAAWYGILTLAGVVASVLLARRDVVRMGLLPRRQATDAAMIVAMAAFAGGHLLFLATPGSARGSLRSGSVLFGAILAGAAAVSLVARYHRVRVGRALDAAAPAGVLPPLFGRVGCFMTGCCHGTPTDVPWAVTFRDESARAPTGIPLHPTQLYEAGVLLAMFVVLLLRRPRRAFDGETGVLYLGIYSLARFLLEYLRGDAARGYVAGGRLSFSQAIAIPSFLVAVTVYGFARARRSGRKPAR